MPSTMFHGDLATSKRILYTPSAFAKSSLLYLQEIGELEANQPHVSARKDLGSYLFMMVKRGRGSLTYRGQKTELTPGACVLIDCRTGYAHATSDDLWVIQWVHFSGSAMGRIYTKYLERGGKNCFHPEDPASLEAIWKKLYETADSSDSLKEMHLNQGLTALITDIMEQSCSPENSGAPDLGKKDLQGVKAYLDLHFREKLSLEQIAGTFFMNKYYLAHSFKESFGMTVVEYLQYKRITQAKQMLRFSDLTVEEVARECGMEDANYFSRTFHKIEGLSPVQYRKLWIN